MDKSYKERIIIISRFVFQFIFSVAMYIILVSSILCGCSTNQQSPPPGSGRRLMITAVNDESSGFTTITPDQLGGNYSCDIVYFNLRNVAIDIDGANYPLETAIHDGLISIEEIIAYTRIDARNGLCTEKYTTNHDLTQFTYTYPEYEIRITYDIFKSPTGKEHLINDIGIYMVGSEIFTGYKDEETGEPIDKEDWGITFEIADATSSNLSLICYQTAGQHIGKLYIDIFGLYYADNTLEHVQKADGSPPAIKPEEIIYIQNDGITEISLEWKEAYGTLPSGKYKLYMYISDKFDPSIVHPLMEDFKTEQIYWIEFAIP